MADFSLRALVRQVANRSTIRNPDDLAEEIVRQIPPDFLLKALADAIKPMVREVIAEDRPHGVFTSSPGRQQKHGAIGSTGPAPGSAKVDAIRDGWQRSLRARYSTGPGAEDFKFLGECTYDDLQYIAGQLDQQAERYASKARGLRTLARALTEHKAATVRDLPAETLMTSLGAAA